MCSTSSGHTIWCYPLLLRVRVLFAVSFEGLPGQSRCTNFCIDAAFVAPAFSAVRAPHRTGSASHDPRRVGLELYAQVSSKGTYPNLSWASYRLGQSPSATVRGICATCASGIAPAPNSASVDAKVPALLAVNGCPHLLQKAPWRRC